MEKWNISPALRERMRDVARQLRRAPTRGERILWGSLRDRGLDRLKFRRQEPIGPFVVGFFCSPLRLIVEVDGGVHESQRDLDQQRQELLASLGLWFIRLDTELVESNLREALNRIRSAVARHSDD